MLEVKNLNFRFAHRLILDDISLRVGKGEILFVRGDNGSGKTTLLKTLTGNLKATRGTVILPRNFNFLPAETNGLFLDLPAFDQMVFWAEMYGVDKSLAAKCLQNWGLVDPYLTQKISVKKFSTGMKRKLALARLQLSHAAVYLLDEPCNGLDSKSTSIFRSWCKQETSEQGKAFVIVSHDEDLLDGLAFQTLELNKN